MNGPLFRFVILHHTGWTSSKRPDHWDWMLESPPTESQTGESHGLLSFTGSTDPRKCWIDQPLERKPEHRIEYLDYEGPISHGRGQVKRVAVGRMRWLPSTPLQLRFDLVQMEFLEPPFAPWPTGQYCLLCSQSDSAPTWHLVREVEPE